MIILGLGTAAGLALALPVQTGSVACPPAQEGRVNCLVQNAWAPAFVKLAATILVVWLLADLLARVPALYRRWRAGERVTRRAHDHGRSAVLSDGVLAAASWGIVPEAKPAWRVVKPQADEQAVRALRTQLPAPAEPAPEPVTAVVAPRITGVRALGAEERGERFRRGPQPHLRLLHGAEVRSRKLRSGNDPALVVSCWSDATAARSLPDALPVGAVSA
jgi:hypothetical protein